MLSPLSIEILILWSTSFCFGTKINKCTRFFTSHNVEASAVMPQLMVTKILVIVKGTCACVYKLWNVLLSEQRATIIFLKNKGSSVYWAALRHIYITWLIPHSNPVRILNLLCRGNLNLKRAKELLCWRLSPPCHTWPDFLVFSDSYPWRSSKRHNFLSEEE